MTVNVAALVFLTVSEEGPRDLWGVPLWGVLTEMAYWRRANGVIGAAYTEVMMAESIMMSAVASFMMRRMRLVCHGRGVLLSRPTLQS